VPPDIVIPDPAITSAAKICDPVGRLPLLPLFRELSPVLFLPSVELALTVLVRFGTNTEKLENVKLLPDVSVEGVNVN